MKLKADTSEVVWSTLIGGNAVTEAATIAVDGSENVYVQGRTTSTTGLIGPGGLQPTFGGGTLDIFLIQIKQENRPKIEVLTSTTRWKPQRSDSPITVDFAGPDDVDVTNGVLEIAGPAGTITFNGPIARISPTGPFTYRMEWTGPWTYTDAVDGQVKRLPPANYPIVVVGRVGAAPNQREVRSASYDKVSLVEVQQVRLEDATGLQLQGNPGPGGGKRIFAETAQAGGTVTDKVKVTATIFPPVPDARRAKAYPCTSDRSMSMIRPRGPLRSTTSHSRRTTASKQLRGHRRTVRLPTTVSCTTCLPIRMPRIR
jgi:hypothetical protein